jgi:hypothetical protein
MRARIHLVVLLLAINAPAWAAEDNPFLLDLSKLSFT